MTLTLTTADLLENEAMGPRSGRPTRRSLTAKYKLEGLGGGVLADLGSR